MACLRAIGLMSGTSLDGVDAALLTTDGVNTIQREAFTFLPYPAEVKDSIRQCFGLPPHQRAAAHAVEEKITALHADAVQKLLHSAGRQAAEIDLIGFHGQTISHNPAEGYTLQIGDGATLARMTGIPVINDFRSADVQAGGQGAPLVPIYHQALAHELEKPIAFVNIGGVANVTYIGKAPATDETENPESADILAFDTGAGNALIDDWVLQHTGTPCDTDGLLAARGTVDTAVLEQLMDHPFFQADPPKSLDRNAFSAHHWRHLSLEDGAATLSAFTVAGITHALSFFSLPPQQWIVCGGGRHNRYLMQALQQALRVPVHPIEHFGFNGDATEAEAFAYLAVRSHLNLPLSFPSTTGVPHPLTGGVRHAPPAA